MTSHPLDPHALEVADVDELRSALRGCVEAMGHAACVLDSRGDWQFFYDALDTARGLIGDGR